MGFRATQSLTVASPFCGKTRACRRECRYRKIAIEEHTRGQGLRCGSHVVNVVSFIVTLSMHYCKVTMSESDKYSIALRHETSEPYLSSLEATYILTMSTSSRLHAMDERLMNMARRTYIQTNRGFRSVPTDGVHNTSMDIVHAVRNVCKHSMENNPGYILILEDDAILLTTAPLAAIDKKLKRGVNLYSFGSIGLFIPCGLTHARVVGNFIGFAQSIIYSLHVQQKLLQTPINDIKHIDAHFLGHVQKKYACVRPVIVQLLPHTMNMDEWSISAHNTGQCERTGVRMFVFFVQRVMKLDRYHHGWYAFYACNYLFALTVASAIVAGIICLFLEYNA